MNLREYFIRTFIFTNMINVYSPLGFAKHFSYIHFHFILPTYSGIMSYSYLHLLAEEHEYHRGFQQETQIRVIFKMCLFTRGNKKVGEVKKVRNLETVIVGTL